MITYIHAVLPNLIITTPILGEESSLGEVEFLEETRATLAPSAGDPLVAVAGAALALGPAHLGGSPPVVCHPAGGCCCCYGHLAARQTL